MNKSLGNLEVYRLAVGLADKGWDIYTSLPKTLQFSIGDQFIRAVDSIGANIAEGYGRFHYKDKINFYYHARGSLWECKHWCMLLYRRELIDKSIYDSLLQTLESCGRKLNALIQTTGRRTVPNDQ